MNDLVQQKYNEAIKAVGDFNTNNKQTPFGTAATAAQNGLNDISHAIVSFKSGDTMGGVSNVMKSIGSFSSALALAGPAGAAAGMLISAITGLISAILDGLAPITQSLESKIEKIVAEQSIKDLLDDLKGGMAAWRLVLLAINEKVDDRKEAAQRYENQQARPGDEETAAGYDWDKLPTGGFDVHSTKIFTAFSRLQSNASYHSEVWIALYECAISYSVSFWLAVESLGGLIKYDEAGANKGTYERLRKTYAGTLLKNIESVYFDSLNEVDFYHLYLTGTAWPDPYTEGTGMSGSYYNSIYKGVGVIGGGPSTAMPGSVATFAVAASGTIFGGGTEATLYVGRGGTWGRVDGCKGCDQVFITESPDNQVMVVSLYADGAKFCLSKFNDATGVPGKDPSPRDWSYGEWRFGPWTDYAMPDDWRILTMAIGRIPGEDSVSLLALCVNHNGGAGLFKVHTQQNTSTVVLEDYDGGSAWWGSVDFKRDTFNIAPKYGRSELSPCTITLTASNIFVQVGNIVKIKENGQWHKWDLSAPGFFYDRGIKCYQLRAYNDLSVLCATNKGVYFRCHVLKTKTKGSDDPSQFYMETENWKKADIETQWLWKQENSQALIARYFINSLMKIQ